MNFGRGGQNIVQSGSNNPNVFRNAGGILNRFLGTRLNRQERDYHRQKDEESRIRVNEASNKSRVKSNLVEGFMSPQVVGNYFDVANKTLGEDHPDVVSGSRQANDLERPQFAHFVNSYGVQTSKHGILPGQPAKGVLQEEARAERQSQQDENATKKSKNENYAGTVARFSTDKETGEVTTTREKLTEDDVDYKRGKSQTPPDSMRSFDDSDRPSNQTWSDEQKADLEKERPRTTNLNNGLNDGKGGNK